MATLKPIPFGLVVLAVTSPVAAQTEIELRAATSEYWFIDLSHTIADRIVLDGVYVGWPGLQEAHVGLGVLVEPVRSVIFIPLVYAVSGTEGRGVTAGAYVAAAPGGWRIRGFAGRFFGTDGAALDYAFVDALEVTHVVGGERWEIGGAMDMYATAGAVAWLLGPRIKRNDPLGAWGASLGWGWGGSPEFRLTRLLAF